MLNSHADKPQKNYIHRTCGKLLFCYMVQNIYKIISISAIQIAIVRSYKKVEQRNVNIIVRSRRLVLGVIALYLAAYFNWS